MSSSEDTPPEAMRYAPNGSKVSSIFFCDGIFGPESIPSVSMSVYINMRTPPRASFSASSKAVRSDTSTQPFMATFPPFASMPTAILSPYFSAREIANSGFVQAFVPIIARPTPASNARLTEASSRRPPPSSTNIPSPAIFDITSIFAMLPPNAPSRSTTCITLLPASAKDFAASSGFSKYTVLFEASPIFRRTHLPSFMSTAG